MFLKAALRSLLVMTIVSIIMGAGTLLLFHSFFGGLLIAYVIQILGGYVWNTYLERREAKLAQTLTDNLQAQIKGEQIPLSLSCAYCNTVNKVPFTFNKTTFFKCVSCNQPNKIYIQFTTVRITTPLLTNPQTNEIVMEDDEENMRQTTINEPIKIKSEK